VGQVSLDRVWFTGEAGASAEPPVASEWLEFTGGQVATALLALARLGLRVAYSGAVGDDAAAQRVLEPLQRAGVDCGAVKRVHGGRTRRARIRVERGSGEREVVPERDPRVALAPADLEAERIRASRALLVDLEDPEASIFAAGVANTTGAAVVLDADRLVPDAERLLSRVDFPIVSRSFAESLGDGSAREGLRTLAARARCLAVVTLGADGAIARAAGGGVELASPGFRVAARDTTGAGDAFHAGFVWGLLEGLDAAAVLRTANAAAALNCLAPGAQGGLPDRGALEGFLIGR